MTVRLNLFAVPPTRDIRKGPGDGHGRQGAKEYLTVPFRPNSRVAYRNYSAIRVVAN